MVDKRPQTAQERTAIAARFGAADAYDSAATIQRLVARRLLDRIVRMLGDRKPARILEFGCGTGAFTALLQERWPEAQLLATDIAPEMLDRARARCGEGVRFAVMDAATPAVDGSFDLICGNLALQWVEPPEQALSALYRLLTPGGLLAVSTLAADSFSEWRQAHVQQGVAANIRVYPKRSTFRKGWPEAAVGPAFQTPSGQWTFETLVEQTHGGLAFLRGLKRIGATAPVAGGHPLTVGVLRNVVRHFDAAGSALTWDIAFGLFRRAPRAGVFVTGTDTGVGKTFISACLTRAWDALYWKPLQTGLADEAGDTPTVTELAEASADRILPPADTFLAPLSPQAAAAAEGRRVNVSRLILPMLQPERPLVVEGAGGVDVPVTEDGLLVDRIAEFGLPVVVVARSGLGTVNHTLLTLEALRRRGIGIAGVVLNGPLNPGNRAAIEEHGRVAVLAEVPFLENVTAESVAEASRLMPRWSSVETGSPDGTSRLDHQTSEA
ncbi:dethiobiotin synthase [Acetobacter sp.]|jgi:malonyl-CoA O-methyltransferase|uniref:dethiobiotin synthase n=1 Tax=Acetobacter sp. TaxID=440 RepID=UPI0025C193D6|nr:dethiobiotin synthase [Acetobacter sp.]MCH4091469.1 dethiobiotin synthase [Acetobacter sp.]MCI1299447.1 dethiobiotin synthase [Acetobacter sp.]MCI1316963.1 dethiobiotin synthase [Acetobacter sp.]